jgi:hypothetical protein
MQRVPRNKESFLKKGNALQKREGSGDAQVQ